MTTTVVPYRVFRFGAFELNEGSGELRKYGSKIKIQDQPLQILSLLLDRAGQVVSREDIRRKLWPENTFVDFDNAISSAVRKLREALSDVADNPRFIETLARRGYRFIAPVQEMTTGAMEFSDRLEEAEFQSLRSPPAALQGKPPLRRAILLGIVGLAAASLFAALLFNRLRQRTEANPENGALHRVTSDPGLTTDPVFSPDGRLLAYASDRGGDGHLNIWIQQVTGGAAMRLTHSEYDERAPSFSPDGAQIAFRSERGLGGIYVVSSLRGEPRLVAPGGRRPQFSPDGKWIAYWVGQDLGPGLGVGSGKTYVAPSAGGSPREVSAGLVSAGAPIWSPDGKYLLAFGLKDVKPHYKDDPDWWALPVTGGTPVKTGAFATFQHQGLNIGEPDPTPAQWIGQHVLFSAKLGDGVDLWRVKISPGDWQVTSKAERLTSVAGQAVSASMTADGHVAFANLSARTHLWSLRLDANSGGATPVPTQLTDSAAAEYWPSVSEDGRRLAFTSTRDGKRQIWMRDLSTGNETALPSTAGQDQEFPKFSPDGKRIAFTLVRPEGGRETPSGLERQASVYVSSTETMLSKRVLENGDWVWAWTPDGRYLLTKWGAGRRVRLLNLASGEVGEFLNDADEGVWQPTCSSDGRWITFNTGSGIFTAPYRGPSAIPKRDWITVVDGRKVEYFDDKPRWSADGTRLYFTSDRDGFRCLWTQRLNPASKTPMGAPAPLYHFHSARRSISNTGLALADIVVSKDVLIFPQTELDSNIWMTRAPK